MVEGTIALALSATVTEDHSEIMEEGTITRIDINVGTVTVFRHMSANWHDTTQDAVDEALQAWAAVQH